MGLRPTPRLGRSRGPLRPAPLPRGRAVRAVIVLCAVLGLGACRASAHLRVPDASPALSPTYDALGSGHRLRAVSQDGRYVTLEDGSRWEIHPRDRFRTIDWEPDVSISVRTTRAEDGYAYEVVNTNDDDGAMARLIAVR